MKSSANNNSADQSAHLQSPEPTTEARYASSSAKSCANNDFADQPAHLQRHLNSADQPAHLQSEIGIWYAN